MKFILLVYDSEQKWNEMTEAERGLIMGEYMQFAQGIRATGHYQAGAQLQPTPAARTVRVRDGKRMITDGPFAETREQLGGFFLIEAKDISEATEIATRVPAARLGTVEVRPVIERPIPGNAPTAGRAGDARG